MAVIPAHITLRVLRELRGLTSITLAEKIGDRGVKVDPDHILAVELGHRRAGHALRVAWADELGIRPGDIHFEAELRELIALADEDRGTEKNAA
jgi:transcriptional regulator with XRE-family HTH domain